MKYLFILGRNPELSTAEIFCFFEKQENKILNYIKSKHAILIDLEKAIEGDTIEYLGGTISIGKVMASGEISEMIKGLDSQDIYYGTENNLTYCLWNFCQDNTYDKILEYLKKRFKIERLKASQKNLNNELELQEGGKVRISGGLLDEEYFVFNNNFGKIISKTNYKKLEERDMNKPDRREALAISPRLAKIMINLSQVKKQETLVDCFCGIGVILQEALLQEIKVIGIDKDSEAIEGARKNLEWFKFNKENYNLIKEDSAKTKIKKVEGLVSEPDLGETLKRPTNPEKAKKILNEFERLMISVLNNLKNSVSKRFVFSAPYIKLTNNKRIGCNIESILDKTHLKLVKRFTEYRKDQIVGREIFVLNK